MRICAGSRPKSCTESAAEAPATARTIGMRRVTRACIGTKLYHRRTESLRRHVAAARSTLRSRLIGWWTVAASGTPRRSSDNRP